jgi:hypothetical protein
VALVTVAGLLSSGWRRPRGGGFGRSDRLAERPGSF